MEQGRVVEREEGQCDEDLEIEEVMRVSLKTKVLGEHVADTSNEIFCLARTRLIAGRIAHDTLK